MKKFFIFLLPVFFCNLSFSQKKGSFKDPRDGKVYQTIMIDSQTWMAENMNYAVKSSWCYLDDSAMCLKYGRLYNFESAQKACPEGWQLATRGEWDTLIAATGGPDEAGINLSPWRPAVGFKALYGGRRHPAGEYFYKDMFGFYWTSTVIDNDNSWAFVINPASGNIKANEYDKWQAYSVRCIKK